MGCWGRAEARQKFASPTQLESHHLWDFGFAGGKARAYIKLIFGK